MLYILIKLIKPIIFYVNYLILMLKLQIQHNLKLIHF